MRTTLWIAVVAAALAAAAVAVARSTDGNVKGITRAAATFTATTTSSQTRTCTTAAGKAIATTTARYSGAATGGDLTGPITVSTRSVINTNDDVGTVDGSFRIVTSAGKTDAHFTAVYDGGTLSGLAQGHTAAHAELIAAISAGYGAGGFTSGKLGGGTAGGSAVELAPGHCSPTKPVQQTSAAKGIVSAVSSTSITVAGLTCSVPASLTAKLAGVSTGSRAEIKCSLSNGTNTLVSFEKKG
jgi:hypothetical protein